MAELLNFGPALSELPANESIETAYLLIRLFRYRQAIRAQDTNLRESAMLHVVTKERGKSKPDRAAQTALAIAKAIEEKEASPLANIDNKTAEAYVKSLSKFVFQLSSSGSKFDRVRGKSLLADLRVASYDLIGNSLLKR